MNDLELAKLRKSQVQENPSLVISASDVIQLCDAIIELNDNLGNEIKQRAKFKDEHDEQKKKRQEADKQRLAVLDNWKVEKADLEAKRKKLKQKLKAANLDDSD